MDIVVVESPAKAKTINKYLGRGYKVFASFGHVRDLPPRDGSVRPDDGFAMDWTIDPRARKHLNEIADALKGATHLYLATDPDREGEAISWHVNEVLKADDALNGIAVERVVFHEITKNAVLDAIRNPRELDRQLVDAYLARRALDYLVGFTLSPVLWRKLPGSRSAGRVQSVALRLICERESEIEAFKPREYWTVEARLRTPAGAGFAAQLTHLDGTKLDKFALADEAKAKAAVQAIEAGSFKVETVEKKQVRRFPAPPFTTSTLQQEAARKLGFTARQTMQTAQRLYEGVAMDGDTVGLITYMRTDALNLSGEAITAARSVITAEYGAKYLPGEPRVYKTKAKNAQEAHEAIRPTDLTRRPQDAAKFLDPQQAQLYEIIWKRTVASQMEEALLDQVGVDITPGDGRTKIRATGQTIAFDGFLKLYREDIDDPTGEEDSQALPPMTEGQALGLESVKPEQHFTQPPPRYSEASLVKKLEELGIGRPSTYASILSVLQARNYVRLEKRRFIPEDRGRLVTAFLTSFFKRYVEYDFTADLENQLDDISGGRIEWKTVLERFWKDFSTAVAVTKELRVTQVLDALNQEIGPHFFPDRGDGTDPRACPSCKVGQLSFKVGRYGAFIGCNKYPECRYTRPLAQARGEEASSVDVAPRQLGNDPATGLPVSVRKGPYGVYVQLGEAAKAPEKATKGKKSKKDKDVEKPKRATLPKGDVPDTITLDRALQVLSLPRTLGPHPETGEPIQASIGRYGPYVRVGHTYARLKDDDVFTVGLNRAISLLADAAKKSRAKPIGEHPEDKKPIFLSPGRFGSYLRHGDVRSTVPKEIDTATLTVEKAVEILAARSAKNGGGPKKAGAGAKAKPKAAANAKAKPDTDAETAPKAAAKPRKSRKKAPADPATDA